MRAFALALLVAAAPAHAWEFTPRPVCTLSHATAAATVDITHGAGPEPYAITLALRDGAWPAAPVFALRFDGPAGYTITTTRHFHPDGDRSRLRVTDRGFDNLLDGIARNMTATALLGDRAIGFGTDDAAGPVAAFRACIDAPLA